MMLCRSIVFYGRRHNISATVRGSFSSLRRGGISRSPYCLYDVGGIQPGGTSQYQILRTCRWRLWSRSIAPAEVIKDDHQDQKEAKQEWYSLSIFLMIMLFYRPEEAETGKYTSSVLPKVIWPRAHENEP